MKKDIYTQERGLVSVLEELAVEKVRERPLGVRLPLFDQKTLKYKTGPMVGVHQLTMVLRKIVRITYQHQRPVFRALNQAMLKNTFVGSVKRR